MKKNDFPCVIQVIDTYYPNVDGVVRTVDNYAKYINDRSYSCVIAPYQGDNSFDDGCSYDILRIKSIKLPMAEYRYPLVYDLKKVKKLIEENQIDAFHIHSPFIIGNNVLKLAKKNNIKVISTFHSKYYDDILNITHSKLLAKLVTKSIVKFYNKVDSVWAVSSGTADTLREYGYKKDIFIMDNGTDYEMPSKPDELIKNVKKIYNLKQNIPTMLFVGHQIWQKNLKLVLNTAFELKKRNFKFQLIIAGDGYNAKDIKSYANKLELNDCVIFTGLIKDKNILKGLELFGDVMFFPSMYDNAPLVVREAAAMGMPAILLKGSNAAEPTKHNENAFHCENNPIKTADLIINIFSNKELIKNVGQTAKNILGKSWDEIMPLVKKEYVKIIND